MNRSKDLMNRSEETLHTDNAVEKVLRLVQTSVRLVVMLWTRFTRTHNHR